jgi:Sel1 repeat
VSGAREGWHFGTATAICVALFSLSCLGGAAFWEQVKIRLSLHWADLFPIRSQPFLDHAAQRLFLQHSGESYQFVHRSLQEFFAGLCLYRTDYSRFSEPDGYLVDILMPNGPRTPALEPTARFSLSSLVEFHPNPSTLPVARACYTQAAEADDAEAQFRLGLLLADQLDPPDLAAARTWYTRAAKQGHTDAQYNLALLLAHLHPSHLKRSRTWLTRAAKAGNVQAQDLLRELWGIEVIARDSGYSD